MASKLWTRSVFSVVVIVVTARRLAVADVEFEFDELAQPPQPPIVDGQVLPDTQIIGGKVFPLFYDDEGRPIQPPVDAKTGDLVGDASALFIRQYKIALQRIERKAAAAAAAVVSEVENGFAEFEQAAPPPGLDGAQLAPVEEPPKPKSHEEVERELMDANLNDIAGLPFGSAGTHELFFMHFMRQHPLYPLAIIFAIAMVVLILWHQGVFGQSSLSGLATALSLSPTQRAKSHSSVQRYKLQNPRREMDTLRSRAMHPSQNRLDEVC